MEKEIKTELIVEFIERNGLTERQFCKMAKIRFSTYEKLIKQDYNIWVKEVFKIAKAMKVEITKLFEY